MQAALHEQFALAFANQRDGLCSRRIAVRSIDDFGPVDRMYASGRRRRSCRGSDENGLDDSFLSRLHRTPQRGFVARMHDEGGRRLHGLGPGNEAVVFGCRWGAERVGAKKSDMASAVLISADFLFALSWI